MHLTDIIHLISPSSENKKLFFYIFGPNLMKISIKKAPNTIHTYARRLIKAQGQKQNINCLKFRLEKSVIAPRVNSIEEKPDIPRQIV